MNHFSRNNRFDSGKQGGRSGGGGFNKRNFGGGRGSGPSQMHSATCGNCGRHCEVPFRPTGNRPVLCSDCFQDSKGGQRSGPRRDFGDRGRDSRQSAMHHAVCSDCGRDCEVPFKPTGNKPIFCSDCFAHQKSGGFKDRSTQKPHFQDRKMHIAICANCGDKCKIPFIPKGGKAVYCNACFGRDAGVKGDQVDSIKEQFEVLNGKLDKLIKLLLPVVSPQAREKLVEMKDFVDIPEGPLPTKEEKKKPVKKEKSSTTKAKVEKKSVEKKTAKKKAEPKKKASTKAKPKKKVVTKKTIAKKATPKKESVKKKPKAKKASSKTKAKSAKKK